MRLDHATWPEIETYLKHNRGIIVPLGSMEQHGPMGLIGTDALCAQIIADRAANRADACSAPSLVYAPAPFNTGFPGTVSVRPETFAALLGDVVAGLQAQGFVRVYLLNGHGANTEPARRALADFPESSVKLRSWWDFDSVAALRKSLYGDWEGMHATPSEVAITQAEVRIVEPGAAAEPPEKLSAAFIEAHAGDRHGPPDEHRARFPDGRVGSHSALARPEHGRALIDAAASNVARDFLAFQDGT